MSEHAPDAAQPKLQFATYDMGKRAEDALRESEAFTRSIINSSPDCIKVLDLEGNLLSIQCGQLLLGIEDIQPFLNTSWLAFWEGEHRQAAQAAVALAAAGDTGRFVGFFHTFRGEPRWWDVVISPIIDARGKPARLLAVSRDVTQRRQAELNFAFLASVSRDLLHWSNMDEMMRSIGAKMAAHLQLSVCALAEINESAEQVVINHDWHREDVPGLIGVYRLADFVEEEFIRVARAGDVIVVRNAATDSRTDPEKFATLKIASFVCVPLILDGQWRFALCLYHSTAYDWREDEIELARELTARIWTRMERLRAEAALRENEWRLRYATASAGLTYVEVDLVHGGARTPENFASVMGYAPPPEPNADVSVGARTLLEHVVSHDRPQVEAALQQFIGAHPTGKIDYRVLGDDQVERWIETRWSMEIDPDGKPLKSFATNLDITERKRTEEALRESEARFRAAVDIVSSLIWISNAHGLIEGEQPGWGNFTGQTQAEYQAYGWSNAVHPEDAQPTLDAWAQAVAEKRLFEFEHRIRRRDGEWRLCSIRAVPLFGGDGIVREWVGVHTDITARKQAENALLQRTAQFKTLINEAPLGIYMIDADFHIRQVNSPALPAFENISDPIGRDFAEVMHILWPTTQADEIVKKFRHTLETGEPCFVPEMIEKRADRQTTEYYEWQINRIALPEGDFGVVCYFRDISERVLAQQQIRESEERYRMLFNSMDQGYCIIEVLFDEQQKAVDFRYLEVNPAFEKQSGLHNVTGQRVREIVPGLEQHWLDTYSKVALTGKAVRFVNKAESMGDIWFDLYAFRIGGSDSHKVAVLFTDITANKNVQTALHQSVKELRAAETGLHTTQLALLKEKGSLDDNVLQLQDANGLLVTAMITAQTHAEEIDQARAQLVHMAQHDALTGLPNRILLNDRLAQAMALAQRQGKQLALMFLDLDHFKYINDSLGHGVGDQLLLSVAHRLTSSVRASDTVCRQGGDEFVILLADVEHAEDAALSAKKILTALTTPHHIDGLELHVTVSIGISIYPDDAVDADTLIKNADTAMYHAKENGRNSFQFFKTRMNVLAVERHAIENELRGALARQELRLFYQPKINLESGRISGVEALLRWQHPQHGLILPEQFIWIAEDSGLIVPIGMWVLHEACRLAQSWQDAGLSPLSVAVNVSAVQFRHPDFLKQLADILDDTRLAPQRLELELTESVLMEDSNSTIAILNGLKVLGVRLAIDDFGTGNSSLSYLKRFNIDTLKIDQSFLRDINHAQADSADAAIISAVVGLGKNLNLRVVVEGVETPEQLAFLQAYGGIEGQGFYFSPALAAENLLELLQTGRSFTSSPPTHQGDSD